MKGTSSFVVLAALALLLAGGEAQAQDGRVAYCGPNANANTCGPALSPGRASSCSNSGCHAINPLNDAQGRAMRGAGSLGAIQGSPDQGMQAIISLYTMAELQAIADWLLSLTAGGAPSCSVTPSNPSPATGTSITLTASCSNAPTGYAWTGCTSSTSTCTATSATAATRTYTVVATNASGQGSGSTNVTWIVPGTTPPPVTPPPPPPPVVNPLPPTTTIVEYFHAQFGHYFVTSVADEITKLDNGTFVGWSRTGRSFKAFTASNGDQRSVCRFFTVAFPPKSSHFYTSNTQECNDLRRDSKVWQYEADAFWVTSADAVIGACPTGTQAVYRLYNNGQSGAPNHRYTTDPAMRVQMMGQGWIPEGFGPEGVGFCAPL